ncbi:MAG: cytochrome c oxidase accessory protein CcoG [Hyphomonadaceae bacterium]
MRVIDILDPAGPTALASGEAAHGVVRSDAVAVNSAMQRELYEKRQQIYPKAVFGFWRRFKWLILGLLLGIYYVVPFLRWDRPGAAPDQFLLADFTGRRFYFGPIEIWPQELYYVTGLLILAAIGLFLASALFGRVWCGYACPQTVWTDLFIAVEHWFEGDRNQRIRLDKQAWDFNKAWRKIAKHIVWLMISLATGGWFVAYFHDAPSLFVGFFTLQAPMSAYVFAGLLTATTYVFAGTLREQVCTYMCPWPRIQAAMLDQEALSVTYRYDRGDPRGAHKKNDSWEGRGDCIDCRQCVAACPAGIDIRDGLQIECINCALCIDACDEIMVKVDRPKGLIAYDTIQNIERRQAGEKSGYRFIRGRTLFYAVLFIGIGGLMLASLLMRSTLDVNVQRDRAPLFVPLSTGQVRNAYTVKVLNKANYPRDVRIRINGVRGGQLQANELPVVDNSVVLTAGPDRVAEVRLFVVADPERLKHRSMPVMIEVQSPADGEIAKSKSVFIRGDHLEERDDDD